MSSLKQFTKKYSLTRTLRFELIPVEGTAERLVEFNILSVDQKRADDYKKMKETLDAYHRDFIDSCLQNVKLKGLDDFYNLYTTPSITVKEQESYKKSVDKVKAGLRKEIVDYFEKENGKDRVRFKNLTKKELIVKDLKPWIEQHLKPDGEMYFFEEGFKTFTTYFSGYNQNRINMYSVEQKSTAISYRLIDENLPRFIDNMRVFIKLKDAGLEQALDDFGTVLKKRFSIDSLESVFNLDYYNRVLTQSAIDIYNAVIGGWHDGKEGVKGINGYINEYNQRNGGNKLPKMTMLYKQILSDRLSASWLPDAFENCKELIDGIMKYNDEALLTPDGEYLPDVLSELLKGISKYDLNRIYVKNDVSLRNISNELFGYYGVLTEALNYYYEHVIDQDYLTKMSKVKTEKQADSLEKKKNAYVKDTEYFSLHTLQEALDLYIASLDETSFVKKRYCPNCIAERYYYNVLPYTERIGKSYDEIGSLIEKKPDKNYQLSDEEKNRIKKYLDNLLDYYHYCRPLILKEDSMLPKDELFYGTFAPLMEQFGSITAFYDKVRNYVTKKPYSTDKIKLNFQCKGGFLQGWVDSYTEKSENGTQHGGYLFRKKNFIGEYDYYLGVTKQTKCFRCRTAIEERDLSPYERLDYYNPNSKSIYGSSYRGERSYNEDKRLAKNAIVRFLASNSDNDIAVRLKNEMLDGETITPSGCLSSIRKSSEDLYLRLLEDEEFCEINNTIIDNLKSTMRASVRIPGSDIIANKEYIVFTSIIADIDSLMANRVFNYIPVSQAEMNAVLNDDSKPMFLFKISNKDLAYPERVEQGVRKRQKGHDNLHTMYFKALMSGSQEVYDLGTGEVFFRQASIKRKVTHPRGEAIECKNPNSKKEYSTFDYDLIKDRRYTEDKFFLHLSIVQNFKQTQKVKDVQFNEEVCKFLKNNQDINIIGIDRGERNLLYISMIDRDGRIVRDKKGNLIQYSLNDIIGEYKNFNGETIKFKTPYNDLLNQREEADKDARKNWKTIDSIKELKAGYMSQVISHITHLMVEYNAIVVLEDLNSRFINSRKKVEKQVYQNFEKALLEKMNYLVFKDVPAEAPGGVMNALQLATPFKTFKDLKKQSGFIFYVPAWNTSRIDPVTGFMDLLRPKCEQISEWQSFYDKFDFIRYNPQDKYFEFGIEYANYLPTLRLKESKWVVCTHGDTRYVFNRALNNNKGGYETINVTQEIIELFDKYKIPYQDGKDLKDIITKQDKKIFYSTLTKNLKITMSMRYSNGKGGRDFILSPVKDKNGEFFDSEVAKKKALALPHDADANGAYNIARKGLYVLRQIDKSESVKDWTTRISNTEWIEFSQSL